jgi:plastocyanin
MQFTTLAIATLLSAVSAQKVHVVNVSGGNNTLTFSPDNLKPAMGDMIQFQFRAGNHSVVQSAFDSPCMPMSMTSGNASAGIFSGYQPVAASQAQSMIPTYTIRITSMTPMWLYCSQGRHCQGGMVMVINEK